MWKHPLKWAIIPGLIMIALSVVMMVSGPQPFDNLSPGFNSPIIAFEFMQTHEQVLQFFHVPDPEAYVNSILYMHQWDMGFLVVYSLFLGLVAWGSKREGNMLAYAALLFCPLMAAADVVENFTLNSIALHYDEYDTSGLLQYLNLFTWLKWGSISAMLFCFVPWLFQKRGITGAIVAGIAAAAFGLSIAAYITKYSLLCELFALAVSLSFAGLFAVCLAFRK